MTFKIPWADSGSVYWADSMSSYEKICKLKDVKAERLGLAKEIRRIKSKLTDYKCGAHVKVLAVIEALSEELEERGK